MLAVFDRPLVRRAIYALILAAITLFLVQVFRKAYRPEGYDLTSYLLSAKALLHGANPYHTETAFPYIYPLFLAFVLIPLAALPYWLANFAWYVASLVALWWAVWLPGREGLTPHSSVSAAFRSRTITALLCLLALVLPAVQNHLLNGQVDFLVLLLCVLCWFAHEQTHRVSSGLLLGMAIAIKLVPLILVGYFFLRREWRVVSIALVSTVGFSLLPVVFAGADMFVWYREYLSSFVAANLGGEAATGRLSFTLSGFIQTMVPATSTLPAITPLSIGVVLAFVATVHIAAMRRARRLPDLPAGPRRQANLWLFCLYLTSILLISPSSQTHHLAFLLPGFVLSGLYFMAGRFDGRPLVKICLLLFLVLFYLGGLFKESPCYFLAVVTQAVTSVAALSLHIQSAGVSSISQNSSLSKSR